MVNPIADMLLALKLRILFACKAATYYKKLFFCVARNCLVNMHLEKYKYVLIC